MIEKLQRFREVWNVDFEFGSDSNLRPAPVCMVARELFTRREIRSWKGELQAMSRAPFDVGPETLLVAYNAVAELSCFLALRWPFPHNVVDLYVEHRLQTNAFLPKNQNNLLAALAMRRLAHIDAGEKTAMRHKFLTKTAWSAQEQKEGLDYCATDVDAGEALLPVMLPSIDLPAALYRGRYMAAAARMEHAGVPVDAALYRRMTSDWEKLKLALIRDVDANYGVYEDQHFRAHRFADYLARQNILDDWPVKNGNLLLDRDTFRSQAQHHPQLEQLRQLRTTLNELRLTDLRIGADGRNRCSLFPFWTATGRNQPPPTQFIFGPARWCRGLIRPPEGYGLVYVDWSAQEFAILAGLSGDEQLIKAYENSDPYLAFAKEAKLAPPNATKRSHPEIRNACKRLLLGVPYGMTPQGLAMAVKIPLADAREIYARHRATYRRFWSWSDDRLTTAQFSGEIHSEFGWRQRVTSGTEAGALKNFPAQANGAEMMRIAAIAATEAEIEVCCPVHDAFLIAAPLDRLEADVAHMRDLMTRAGRTVTGGLDVRTDAMIVRYPDRYMDDGGSPMWNRVMRLIDSLPAEQVRVA
jgi:DNA polymerase-1